MLMWSAAVHSPTVDEPAHLASGLYHWRTGDFRPYCVNPHLPRMLATLAVTFASPDQIEQLERRQTVSVADHSRPEWEMGDTLVKEFGGDVFHLTTIARLSNLPFAVAGALACFFWAKSLYGPASGCVSLLLWCFLPEILGHGALLTPDVPAAAAGVWAGYTFWRFLKERTPTSACWAGFCLGLALLTKTTWIILFVLWPLLWLISRLNNQQEVRTTRQFMLLLAVVGCGWLVLNVGYLFHGTFRRIGTHGFTSEALAGPHMTGKPGNRFRNTVVNWIPTLLPEEYVAGIDLQKEDFEEWRPSYLGGDFHPDGVWYFYLYAASVKLPLGFLILLGMRLLARNQGGSRQNATLLWLVPVVIIVLASSMTRLAYFRYLMPAWPYLSVWVSKLASDCHGKSVLYRFAIFGPLVWMILSSVGVYPHSLSYFNEAAGGPRNGHAHLIDSHIDWGQDLLLLRKWREAHPGGGQFTVAYYGPVAPSIAGIDFQFPASSADSNVDWQSAAPPGWYAISVHFLRGGIGRTYGRSSVDMDFRDSFLRRAPVDRVGHSILIYKIP